MRHNTLLHRDTESQTKAESEPDTTAVVTYCTDESIEKSRSSKKIEDEEYITNIHCVHKPTSSIILSTARVQAYDIDGNPQICQVLLDPGSQSNLITESFARQLKLRHKTEHRPISGINLAKTNASKVVTVRIESLQEDFSTNLECLMLPNITEQLPQSQIDVTQIAMPKSIRLADPVFDKPGQINLLVGAGFYWKILVGNPKNQVPGQPALQNTRLDKSNDFGSRKSFRKSLNTKEEKYCEEYFVNTVKREPDGRFIVRLPQRSDVILGDSKEQAYRRLLSLERRFSKDPELQKKYVKFMDDYLKQGHMSVLTDEEIQGSEGYVLPHQAVITADVAMMYRQILVAKVDRVFQRILWRKSPSELVKLCELNTVTYGQADAAFLAISCLRQLAAEAKDLPLATKALEEETYMDDVQT
ncbi:uncharacterized protein [Temnothorax nylanderi]|uniref:uncharacterized protein n=1 Tax=Temnothorax nylanderi TaxID=102681 RepID=UPI003A85D857